MGVGNSYAESSAMGGMFGQALGGIFGSDQNQNPADNGLTSPVDEQRKQEELQNPAQQFTTAEEQSRQVGNIIVNVLSGIGSTVKKYEQLLSIPKLMSDYNSNNNGTDTEDSGYAGTNAIGETFGRALSGKKKQASPQPQRFGDINANVKNSYGGSAAVGGMFGQALKGVLSPQQQAQEEAPQQQPAQPAQPAPSQARQEVRAGRFNKDVTDWMSEEDPKQKAFLESQINANYPDEVREYANQRVKGVQDKIDAIKQKANTALSTPEQEVGRTRNDYANNLVGDTGQEGGRVRSDQANQMAGTSPSTQDAPRPQSQAEIDKLPSGTTFIWLDGKTYTKD